MKVKRERTEVVKHREQTFITRLPTTIEVDIDHFRQYNQYCGTRLLRSRCVEDHRFRNLSKMLFPVYKSAEDARHSKFKRRASSLRRKMNISKVEPLPV